MTYVFFSSHIFLTDAVITVAPPIVQKIHYHNSNKFFKSKINILNISRIFREPDSVLLWRTCADEHDVILSVLCLHSVHHQLGELVVHICPHHDGAPPYGMHWVVHGWVTPSESDDIIGEVLGGVEPSKGFTGTLRGTRSTEMVMEMFTLCRVPDFVWNALVWKLTVPGRG